MKINASKEIEFWKQKSRDYEFMYREQKRISDEYRALTNDYQERIKQLQNQITNLKDDFQLFDE